MEKKHRYITALIVFFAVLICVFIKKEKIPQKNEKIITIPRFKTTDINGNEIKSSDLIGNNIYFQFVNPLDVDDMELLNSVYSNWKDENLNIIVATNDFEKFKLKTEIDMKKIIIISKQYKELKSKFESPPNVGTYYLFNDSGNILDAGKTYIGYERRVLISLLRLVKNRHFSISDFIEINRDIENIEWFSQVSEIVEKENKDYFVVSMFTSICDTCPEGSIINSLKKLHSKRHDNVFVLCVFNHNFDEKDIDNLRSQLDINFPIIIADSSLDQKWTSLIKEFGEAHLTNIVFVMDRSGKILKILDRSCNCTASFFLFVFSLTKA